jgi:hypothetical protein
MRPSTGERSAPVALPVGLRLSQLCHDFLDVCGRAAESFCGFAVGKTKFGYRKADLLIRRHALLVGHVASSGWCVGR